MDVCTGKSKVLGTSFSPTHPLTCSLFPSHLCLTRLIHLLTLLFFLHTGRKPVAYLTCNGSPPVGDTPSLMTFRYVPPTHPPTFFPPPPLPATQRVSRSLGAVEEGWEREFESLKWPFEGQKPHTLPQFSHPPTHPPIPNREVETLFHEFGHGAQHMLTTVVRLIVGWVLGRLRRRRGVK